MVHNVRPLRLPPHRLLLFRIQTSLDDGIDDRRRIIHHRHARRLPRVIRRVAPPKRIHGSRHNRTDFDILFAGQPEFLALRTAQTQNGGLFGLIVQIGRFPIPPLIQGALSAGMGIDCPYRTAGAKQVRAQLFAYQRLVLDF